MRYSSKVLEKIEAILHENDYKIIYGKGHFQSGYCLLKNKKVIVINKFLDLQAQIQIFIDIISSIEISVEILDIELQKFYYKNILGNFQYNMQKKTSKLSPTLEVQMGE